MDVSRMTLGELAERSGYPVEELAAILAQSVEDMGEEFDWGYFAGVTMERDW